MKSEVSTSHSAPQSFSLRARLRSFTFAAEGLIEFVRHQHNAWIHFVAIALVVILGISFQIKLSEWLWLVAAIGFVLVAEIVNTSIEYLVDLVSPEYNKQAGKVKDLAAGAVLVSAIIAAIIGSIIFVPHFIELFTI